MAFDDPYGALTDHEDDARWAYGTGFTDPLAGVPTAIPDGVGPADLAACCLMLGDGQWHGRRIVPRDYVRRVTTRYRTAGFPLDDMLGYGGLWWTPSEANADGSFFAFGFGEQLLAVDPSRDLILAVTANSDKHPKHVREAWAALQGALDERAA